MLTELGDPFVTSYETLACAICFEEHLQAFESRDLRIEQWLWWKTQENILHFIWPVEKEKKTNKKNPENFNFTSKKCCMSKCVSPAEARGDRMTSCVSVQ